MQPKRLKIWIALAAVALALLISLGAAALYVSDYYCADTVAIQAFAPMQEVRIEQLDDGALAFVPEQPTAGLIFYPGGKVEYTAYQPLMAACAQRGILCVLLPMPFNLAVLDVNAADGIAKQFPQTEQWYVGGHSLGGSMAASYLAKHANEYAGLLLLGSYSTADLSTTDLSVLSLYGSEDAVMNREKYGDCKQNLPAELTELEIAGGCHAYFGMYGAQAGDGTPTISNEEQIWIAADAIADWMTANKQAAKRAE